jgi:CheY-like chemotaxis protein
VDDDPTIVELETTILRTLGYHITGLTSSKEALRVLQDAPRDFDLLLTDMTMPELTGVELSLRIHAIRPEIPIVLCSGFSDLIEAERAREIGIQAFIKKPILSKELAETIRTVLDGAVSNSLAHH